jgi:hypothetical protein
MTDDELAAIETRANAAPRGPWEWGRANPDDDTSYEIRDDDDTPVAYVHCRDDDPTFDMPYPPPNRVEMGHRCAFIAHAREDIPALLAEVRRLRADLEAQWEENHFEHCGRPHGPEKACMWPRPESLPARQASETVIS